MSQQSQSPADGIDKILEDCTVGLLRENNVEPYVGTELVSITDLDNRIIDTIKAKAELQAYILAQVLELIGEDEPEPPVGSVAKILARNNLRAELRQAAQARFGGGGK